MPSTTAPPRVLYVARPARWVRLALIAVGSILVLVLGTGTVSLALADIDPPGLKLAALALVAPAVLVVVVVVGLGQRPRFTVTTQGVVIRTLLRTRRLPWQHIARIEVDAGWVHQGQTLVVLHDGRRLGAPITEARSALRRGESTRDHGPDLSAPAVPTRAAVDAHRRWLRGEFGGSA